MGYLKKLTTQIFNAIDDVKLEKCLQFDDINNDRLVIGPDDRKKIVYTVMKNMNGVCNPKEIEMLISLELDI